MVHTRDIIYSLIFTVADKVKRNNKFMEKGDQQVTRRRSRGGCINCKRSKRKCDEAKPFCQNCSRRKIKCEGKYISYYRQVTHDTNQ